VHNARVRAVEQSEKKKIPCIRSDRRRKKKSEIWPQKNGAHNGTRTHMGMIKRLDLINKEQEGTSHQAALVVGGIHIINTRT
jgi:hypothetical protein